MNGSTTPVQTKSVSVSDTSVFFDNFNVNVNSTSGAVLEVKANFLESYNTGTFKITLAANVGLNAVDLMTSATVNHAGVSSAMFTIGSADAEVTASSNATLT